MGDHSEVDQVKTEAKVTIHPRIAPDLNIVGIQTASQQRKKVNTFWAEVVQVGFSLVLALQGESDENGNIGPWTAKQVAKKNRGLVAQLIEFQIQYGEIPGHIQVSRLSESALGNAGVTLSKGEKEIEKQEEVFSANIQSEAVSQDLINEGFGMLSIFNQAEEKG